MRSAALIVLSLWIFTSCVKDKPSVSAPQEVVLSGGNHVYVVNEGNFYGNNASVSLYDAASRQVVADYYGNRNNAALGDVAQSMVEANGKFYIVVNNSGKIVVCEKDLTRITDYHGFSSPRYLLPVTNKKAYVSDYNANAISVIDLNTGKKEATIACAGWTEKMLKVYHRVFVTNMKRPYLYVINSLNDQITDSVKVGEGAAGIVLDRFDKVWVLSGGAAPSEPARLLRIDPLSLVVETELVFPPGASPAGLCLNGDLDTLYFLNKGVFRMTVNGNSLPLQAFIDQGSRNYYGLGVDPADGRLYISDALDYLQPSNIYIYDAKGTELSFFKAGINANGFYFD